MAKELSTERKSPLNKVSTSYLIIRGFNTFLCLNQFSAHSSDYKRVGALQLGPGHRIPELTAFDSSVIVIKYC